MFNCGLWFDTATLGAHLGAVPDMAALERRGHEALCKVLLRSLPVKPEKRKWTKLCMATDWHLRAVGIMSVLPNLFPRAAQMFRVVVTMGLSANTLAIPTSPRSIHGIN